MVVKAAAALAALAVLGTGYLLYEAQWLRRVEVELALDGLPAALDGLVVAHLSDMHVGFRRSFNLRATRKAFALARAAHPDLIVLTGDFVSGPAGVSSIMTELAGLTAPLGVYAVLGNHDRGQTKTPGVAAADLSHLAEVGVHLLTNECVTVKPADAAGAHVSSAPAAATPLTASRVDVPGEAALQVCGVDEWRHGFADVAAVAAQLDRRPGTVRLLLSHYAQAALEFAPGDVALTFSGDTHGGQICLPWFGGRIMLSQPHARFRDGLYEIDGRRIYVTRGIGTSFLPFRFLCRPEVVIVRLVAG
jgi:predicted MPP superfamily phosphohydrolase